MPRAFLMQYNKKQDVGVIYQEADTTEERTNINREPINHPHEIEKLNESFNNDKEISVTDSEESSTEDEEENMDEMTSDDHGLPYDESEHFDDEEADEGDNEDDSEDEEINIDEISDDESIDDQKHLFTVSDFLINNGDHHRRSSLSEGNRDASKSAADENLNFVTSHERLERNLNKIVGSKNSAFHKPAMGEADVHKDRTANVNDEHRNRIPHFCGSPGNPSFSLSNFFYQMSKKYNIGMPWSPFDHPLSVPGFSGNHFPTESCMPPELLHRQMLHNQMLYYGGQSMMGLSHPLHSMYPYPFAMPGMPTMTKPLVNNINESKFETTERVSPLSNSTQVNQNEQKIEKPDEIKRKRTNDNKNLQNPLSSPESISNSHFKFPARSSIPPEAAHTSSPITSVAPPLLNFPSSTTSALSSPIITPTGPFGSGHMPFPYGSMLGSRRPRDPNRPAPVKKYKCDLCPKAFSRSNTLVTHRRIHTGEKPFKCEVCSRAFRQPGNLTRHRLTHTSVKPFVCVVCKKAFNRASNLHTHMRTHTTFRPFVCPCCGKGFQQKVDLKMHMYTHGSGQ